MDNQFELNLFFIKDEFANGSYKSSDKILEKIALDK
jgi:hypothetical protein